MTDFGMPGAGASFEARGGWVTRCLANEFGLTLEQAAGLVGNLGYESGGFVKLQEIAPAVSGSRGGTGWAQWTASRRTAFEAWCKKQALAPSSDEANYRYLVVELHGAYWNTIAALKLTKTLGAAVFSVGQTYERPGGTTATHLPGYDDRLKWAQRALNGANAAAIPTQPPRQSQPVPANTSVTNATAVEAVRSLQAALAALGRYKGAIDGICGPQTAAAAMAAYQATQGGA